MLHCRNVDSFDFNERQVQGINSRLTKLAESLEEETCPFIFERQLWLQWQVAQEKWSRARAIASLDAKGQKSHGTWSSFQAAATNYDLWEQKKADEQEAKKRKREEADEDSRKRQKKNPSMEPPPECSPEDSNHTCAKATPATYND